MANKVKVVTFGDCYLEDSNNFCWKL